MNFFNELVKARMIALESERIPAASTRRKNHR